MILGFHSGHAVISIPEGLNSGFLAQDGSAQHAVLVDLHHGLDQLAWPAGIADAESGHGKCLRESVQEQGAIPHARQAGNAHVWPIER